MLFKICQNLLFFFYLTAIVICFLMGYFYFEFIAIQFLLLSFDFNTKFNIFFLQSLFFFFYILINNFFLFRSLIHQQTVHDREIGEFIYQFFTLFSKHFHFQLFVNLSLVLIANLIKHRYAYFLFHSKYIIQKILQLRMDWKNKPNQIFNKVKHQMFGKGVESFYFVDQFIHQFDANYSKVLSSHFFNLFLNKIGVFLTTQEIRNIRDLYGKGKQEDLILYIDFLQDVKYSISEKVAGLINQAFQGLDKKNQKKLKVQQLINAYKAEAHPHALSRKKDPQAIKEEFTSAINRKADGSGFVTQAAFVDYYAELNFCIPNERATYFEQAIIGTWNLQNPSDYVSEQRIKEIELVVYEKIRQKSDGTCSEWKAGKKALSYFDLGDNRYVNFEQFKRGLDKFGCNFKQNELQVLFSKYAFNDILDYEDFSKQIMQIDINGMIKKENLFQTKMGTNHFTVKH